MLRRGRTCDTSATSSACATSKTVPASAMLVSTLLHTSAHSEREHLERCERAERHEPSFTRQGHGPAVTSDPSAAFQVREPPRENAIDRALAGIRVDEPLPVAHGWIIEQV